MANSQDVTIRFVGQDAGLTGASKAAAQSLKGIEASAKTATDALNKIQVPESASASLRKLNTDAVSLAKSLGLSFTEAKQFANGLGLTTTAANDAVNRLQQLKGAGASNVQAFRVINSESGITIRQFKALNDSVNQVNAALGKVKGTDNIRALNSSQIELARTLSSSVSGAREFANSLGLSAAQTNTAVQRFREFQAAGATTVQTFRGLKQELGITKDQFLELNKVASVTPGALSAIAAGSGAVALAVGNAFRTGLQSFLAFDSAIRQSGVIAQASQEQIATLRTEVNRLGIVTSKTPQDIANMSVALSRAGFSAAETTSALGGIVAASEATATSLEAVGDIIAKTLRAFQLNAGDSQKVADILTQTVNSTNTEIVGLGDSLKYVSAQAFASNQSLEGTSAILGLLGDAGIQGSQAGTNLAAALEGLKLASAGVDSNLTKLARGKKRSSDAFRLLNVDVRNADGSMKDLIKIIPEISNGLSRLSQGDQDIVSKAIFGVEGGRAIQVLLNQYREAPERLDEIVKKIRDSQGAAAESSRALLEGLPGALQLLEGSLGSFNNRLGDTVDNGIEPLVRAATALLNGFLDLPEGAQNALIGITAFTGALTGAIAVITTYNLLKSTQIALEAKAALATGLSTAATVINQTVLGADVNLKLLNLARTKLITAAEFGYAAAKTFSTAALKANKGALIADTVEQVRNAAATRLGTAASLNTIGILGAIAAAVVVVGARAKELATFNDEIEQLVNNTTSLSNNTNNAINKTKDLNLEIRNQAKEGKKLTDEQRRQVRGRIRLNEQEIDAIRATIAENKTRLAEAKGNEGQENAIKGINAGLEAQLAVLTRQNNLLRTNSKELAGAANSEDLLKAAIENTNAAYEQRATTIEITETKALTALTEGQIKGTKTKEQAESEKLNITKKRIAEELAAERARLKEINSLSVADPAAIKAQEQKIADLRKEAAAKSGDERLAIQKRIQQEEAKLEALKAKPEDQTKAIAESQQRIAELTKQGAENRLQIEQDALNRLIAANEDAERKIAAAQEQRITAVRQKQLQQLRAPGADPAAIERQTQADILKIQQDTITQQIAAKKRAAADLKAAEAAGTVPKDEAIKTQAEIQSEIAKLNQQRIDNEIAALKAKQEEEVRLIEQASAAKRRQSDLAIAGLDAELQASKRTSTEQLRAIDQEIAANARLTQNLDQQNRLLESRANLQRATANVGLVRAQGELDGLRQALELRRELDSGNIEDARVRLALEQGIARLTGNAGATQLQIQAAINQREAQIAEAKKQQLLADQANARAQLQLQNQRLQFEQKRAELDARRQVLLAESQLLEARITLEKTKQTAQAREQEALDALAIARKKGDPIAIADAENRLNTVRTENQTNIQNAQQQVTLAQDQLNFAKENLVVTQQQAQAVAEIAANSEKALLAQQEAERSAFNQVEAFRQVRAEIDLAKAAAADYARTVNGASPSGPGAIPGRRLGGSVTANQPYWVGEAGPEIIVPGANSYVMAARQAAAMMRPASVSVNPDTALLREMRELRKDLRNQRPISNPSYTLINEANPVDKMLRIQMGLMRARY